MDTIELQYILDHDPVLKPLHGLVCAKDQLPIINPCHRRAYIINTHNADQPGEHWVALFFRGRTGIYFDSYGLLPWQRYILPFIENNCTQWIHNTMPLQGQLPTCGQFCLYALTCLAKGHSLHDIATQHQTRPLNDQRVLLWFQHHLLPLYRQAQRQWKPPQCQQCGLVSCS